MGFVVPLFLLGIAAIVYPNMAHIEGVGYGALMITGAVLVLIAGWLAMISAIYRRTSANEAFVRTGLGGPRVILDGGAPVFPIMHQVIPVSLETMKLGVNPKGPDALITHDNLRADVMAQFYIRVQPDREHVMNAARSLGDKSVNAASVEELVSEKLVSALRAIASQMDLFDIHTKRDEFAERVKEHVRTDLEANGLWLESVTVSQLDQTDPNMLADTNVFDAQGKRKITEITAAALVERNILERQAEQARKEKDVSTRQQILSLERQQAEAEATQAVEVAKVRAQKEREQREFVIEQQRAVEVAGIEKERAIAAAQIERDRSIILRDQEKQQTDIDRTKAVEVAGRQKEIAIAEQDAARAQAEAAALSAQAEREKARQSVVTVEQIAEADRDAQKRLIAAKQVVEQDKIKRQTDAEVAAFAALRQAEAERQAADEQAKAQVTLAQASSEAARLQAESETVLKMVDVNVAREQVNVEKAKVDVERQALENRETFAEAALGFERAKLEIEATKEVQIALAGAVGQAMSKAHFQVYGDPTTMAAMITQLTKGLGLGALLDGAVLGLPEEARQAASDAVAGAAESVGAVVKRVAAAAREKAEAAAEGDGEAAPAAAITNGARG